MKGRILASVSAWLAGAAVATGGTLVAVSWIGQGISTAPVRTLSVDQVTSALASMSPSPEDSGGEDSSSPSAPASPAQSPSRSAGASTATSAPRTLTSAGGSVIAVCSASGAYLASWSPAENFQVAEVRRGPAKMARVVFQSGLTRVYINVVCDDAVPTVYAGGAESPGHDE